MADISDSSKYYDRVYSRLLKAAKLKVKKVVGHWDQYKGRLKDELPSELPSHQMRRPRGQ